MTQNKDYQLILAVTMVLVLVAGIGTAYAVKSPAGTDVDEETLNVPKSLYQPQVAFTDGNVFVSVGGGMAREFTPAGAFVQDIDCSSVAPNLFTTGSAFDKDGNFYMSMFDSSTVCKTDLANTVHSAFGSLYSGNVENVLFNAAGHVFSGAVDGDNDIREFDAAGTPVTQYDVATQSRGTDWIDLAADQTTMYYTSEGDAIKRFDIGANSQLADFTTIPGKTLYALRLLPSGGLLVAGTDAIYRVNGAGAVIDTYDVTGSGLWFALNLDPDGTTFWSADLATNMVCRFNIATGGGIDAEDICWSGGTGTVAGLSVKKEITVSQPPVVGGEALNIDNTALLVAGFQSSAIWMIPALAGIAGTGAYYIRTRMNKD